MEMEVLPDPSAITSPRTIRCNFDVIVRLYSARCLRGTYSPIIAEVTFFHHPVASGRDVIGEMPVGDFRTRRDRSADPFLRAFRLFSRVTRLATSSYADIK